MERSFKSAAAALHFYYTEPGKLASWGRPLNWFARNTLEKAKIAQNIERAKELRGVYDSLLKDKRPVEEWSTVFRVLSGYYEVIQDDLMLISAYELHLKSKLLRKNYAIHEICAPKELSKRQKKEPIHKRTMQAYIARGETIKFTEKTLGISTITEKGYAKFHTTNRSVERGFKIAKARRNLVHFTLGHAYQVDKELLDFVEYLIKITKES